MTKIATWNVNSLRARLPQVIHWLTEHQPDVLCLQEIKCEEVVFPYEELKALGYHALVAGQKTYNGVAVLSKNPGHDELSDLPNFNDPQKRLLTTTFNDLRIINIYVPNGESVDSSKYTYKLTWLQHFKNYVAAELQRHSQVLILGDFNIAPDERDVYDKDVWENQVLFSPPERAAFQELLQLGLHDSFRLCESEGGHYSWWDYRAAGFRRNLGLRIDHILISQTLSQQPFVCSIDKKTRANERPSDHAPVLLEFTM